MSLTNKLSIKEVKQPAAWTVFLVFLRLGMTSFGGPIAHLGYFHDEFVRRRAWLSAGAYADLVALCQFLPGPASSQVGMAIGLLRAGFPGALAAWLGFTLPSALALTLFALGMASWGADLPTGLLHGLKIVAVAVVAQAVWGMARSFCIDAPRIMIALVATALALWWPAALGQIGIIVLGAAAGLVLIRPVPRVGHEALRVPFGAGLGATLLVLFLGLLAGLPLLARFWPTPTLQLLDGFYRAGALVFGGGHVVLPLLQAEVVPSGLVNNDVFLAGYGAAQAVPGPLFTFAAFLGASADGWAGSVVALLAIFAPSFLLVAGVLPFWEHLRRSIRMQSALSGVNAAVVGLLLAALYHPVWTSAIFQLADLGLALLALAALMICRLAPWLVVLACGLAGWLLHIVQATPL